MKKILTLAATIALPLLAIARPASPEAMQHVNPDGTIVEYRLCGDENFNYMTDLSSENILSVNTSGYLAPKLQGGKILKATGANIAMLRAAHEASLPASYARSNQARMAAVDFNGRTKYPTIGEVPALVILLEFDGTPFSSPDPVAQYTRFCNEEGYSDYGGKGSVKDYFKACSNGKFSPTFEVYGPVKLKGDSRYYAGSGTDLPNHDHNARFGEAIKEAIEALDPYVEFNRFDLDNDGVIDSIFFLYSGYGQADTGNKDYVWPHEWNYIAYTKDNNSPIGLPRLYADGVEVQDYACSNELNGSQKIPVSLRPYLDGVGAFCHEYGHVLGLPDFYDTSNTKTVTPGVYSVMASGSYNQNSTCPPLFSAYEQWVCRWIEFEEATNDTSYTLYPMSSDERNAMRIQLVKRVPIYKADPDYYVFENRLQTGWDASLPQQGMLIWQIKYDKDRWVNNQVNVNRDPCVRILSVPDNPAQYAWPGDDQKYCYILPSQNILVSATQNKVIDATISNITYDPFISPLVTFDYNKTTQLTDAPVLNSYPTVETASHKIHFSWSEVPGATDYMLTVERRDASGNMKTVGDYNEKRVGNVLSTVVDNVPASVWEQTFTAYVRAFNGIPASATSNKVVFIPAKMTEDTAVDEIEVDVPSIFGGVGCIYAPEDARVFTLGGIETGRENLPAGIYIVKTTNSTAKVMVK